VKESRDAERSDEQIDHAWRVVDDSMMWKMPPVKWEWRFLGNNNSIVMLIADDVSFASGEIFDHMVFHVVLGPGHPENSPRRQIRQMPEIHVGLVEDDDFPRKKARAEFARPRVVVLPGGADHEADGKEAVQIESQVHLGRGFPPPVFRPVHAVGEELEHRGIHGVDAHLESAQHPSASSSRDGRAVSTRR